MDEKFIKAVNKITGGLDKLLQSDFVSRDDFSSLLANADALVAEEEYGELIKDDLDYLWNLFEHELESYIRKGGNVSGFNAEFLANKLRNYWVSFTKKLQDLEGGSNMKEREDRMSSLLSITEDKRYGPTTALDHIKGLHDRLRSMAGDVSKAKVITIDYANATDAATIERLYKQLVEELYSMEETLVLEVEKEEKKQKKAEQELDSVEEPEEPEDEADIFGEEPEEDDIFGGEED